MCGLVGTASTLALTLAQKNIMKQLLYVDALRGAHSTGVYSVQTNNLDDVLVKRDVDGPMFVTSKLWDKATSLANANVMIGHNRYATKGKINSDNAHPFRCDDVVMVHNGTLQTFHGLKDSTKFDTDSETIAHNLASVGVDEAETVISELHGAFALVWFDRRDRSLNFIRNGERDLYIGHDEKKMAKSKVLWWASEKEMLHLCVNRNSVIGSVRGVRLLPEMSHYKINLQDIHLTTVSVTKYKEYVAPVTNVYSTSSYGNLYRLPDAINLSTGYRADDKVQLILGKEIKKTNYMLEAHIPHKDPTKSDMFPVNLYFKNRTYEEVIKQLRESDNFVNIRNQYTLNGRPSAVVDTLTKVEYDAWVSVNTPTTEDSDEADEKDWEAALEEVLDLYPGDCGRLLTLEDMTNAVKQGCAWCGDHIQQEDFHDITWHMKSPVCPACSDWSQKIYENY